MRVTFQTHTKKRFVYILEQYLILTAAFSFLYLVYRFFPYYRMFLSPQSLKIISIFYGGFLIGGIPYYWLRSRDRSLVETHAVGRHPLIILIREIIAECSSWFTKKHFSLSKESKLLLLKSIVKFFFFPTMVQFSLMNVGAAKALFNEILTHGYQSIFGPSMHQLIIASIFFIDTTIFTAAYLIESKKLKNEIKSVEPTLLGWFVALNNYPPFNFIYFFLKDSVKNWPAEGIFDSVVMSTLISLVLITIYVVYLWSTLSLGWKAGNLVNRGIVSHGAYRWVRHPAYLAKNLAWWIASLPTLNIHLVIALLITNVNYLLRAITEERHLRRDPEYRAYMQKVKYRFIPGVF